MCSGYFQCFQQLLFNGKKLTIGKKHDTNSQKKYNLSVMKKIFRKELIIGVCVLAALAILIFGIDFLKGVNVFKAANYYEVSYSNVLGLDVSAPVKVNGFKVGQVREMRYDYEHPGNVIVEISLDRELKVPEGSKAVIASDLLGTATIDLQLGSSDKYLPVGARIESAQQVGLMDNVSENLLPAIEPIFPKVDTLLTSANALASDPHIASSLARLDAITANLESTTRKLNASMSSLPALVAKVNTLADNFVTLSNDMLAISGNVKALPLDSIANELAGAAANLKELTESLNNPDSSIGQLMHDRQLYDNINHTVTSLDSLFIDIKKNPKRYISIKLL